MTPAKTSSAATTSELLARLQRHYIDPSRDTPGGVFITEVGSNGSTAIATRCDALYIGFTTASQRILVGHELKISRSDWLAEIGRKTGKADAWADQCHQWYIVVPHSSIVHDGELPDGWGLMTPGRGNRMAVHTPAAIKTDHTPSWDAVRSIFPRYDTLRAQALIAGDAERMAKAHEKARKQAAQAFQLRLDAERGPEAAAVRYPRSAQTRSNAGEGIADSVSRRELPVTFVPHHDSAWLAETAIAAVGVTAALILLISACLCERSWTTVALMGATALCNPATRVGIRRVRRRAQPADPAWTAA